MSIFIISFRTSSQWSCDSSTVECVCFTLLSVLVNYFDKLAKVETMGVCTIIMQFPCFMLTFKYYVFVYDTSSYDGFLSYIWQNSSCTVESVFKGYLNFWENVTLYIAGAFITASITWGRMTTILRKFPVFRGTCLIWLSHENRFYCVFVYYMTLYVYVYIYNMYQHS